MSVEEFVAGPLRATKKLTPFLFCQGALTNPLAYYLIVEDIVISCRQNFKHAFAGLFSSFFIFDFHYPTNVGLDSVYKFIARLFLKSKLSYLLVLI